MTGLYHLVVDWPLTVENQGDQMPVFPSIERFEQVIEMFNSDSEKDTAGGGACNAVVGVISGDNIYSLTFEATECSGVVALENEDDLNATDFYIELHPDDWKEMIENIKVNGAATADFTLNSLDLESPDGIARSWAEDQYRQDLFFRYNQTFQYFFDASSALETRF